MREQRPDVLLAMGSYASAGPVLGALTCGVPVVLHEANVLPGRAIALFSRWATAVAGSFEETRFYLKRKALVLTGMPLRPGLEHPVHDTLPEGMDRDHFTLLVMGGSQGARAINDTVSRAVCALGTSSRLQVIHITGHADEASVRKLYLEQGIVHKVEAFVQNMASLYAAADLAICRAGAATCAELSVFGVPALLVPHPHGAHQHQMANARAMEKRGAADVIPEDDFTEEWVQEYISEYVQHPARLAKMSEASVKRGTRGGAAKLAELVESVGNQTYTPTDTTAGHDD
jgi:UDP-N-acetylglucosamine--N-acetylmuramyl-(pentapeptide) pyrophosphoryl-undecaprenol N-acetylglucosamine transferase